MKRKQGILCIICSGFFFALMTFFVRLSGDLPTFQKAFFRNIIALFISTIILLRSKDGFKINKTSYKDLFLRSIFGTLGLLCNFYAIDRLAIADANILNKLSPFFSIIMSYFILKEKANTFEWGCVFVAFIGALFVVKPSMNMQFIHALIGVFGGLFAGVAYTYVRRLGIKGERGPVIVFGFSLISSIVCLPLMIASYHEMKIIQLAYLLLAGTCAAIAQLFITKAYTYAPAKEISVFDYTQVLFAALLGFLFLHQIPDIYSFLGYIIILGAAITKWNYNRNE